MDALFNLVKPILAFLAVLLIWFGLQRFIRRRSGCESDVDVLDFMKDGCAGCKGDGACHKRGKEEQHHELT
jgi:hypothetical protein